jgi:quercetin dioxygenase-like cupin family protein
VADAANFVSVTVPVTFIMRGMRIAVATALLLSLPIGAGAQNPAPPPVTGPAPVPTAVWASKPTATPGYRAGLTPWIKLADVKAKHAGQATWTEALFDDGRLMAHYVAAAPGTRQSPRFHPDTREWFAVLAGEVRVEIEGQPPLVATRGSLVNVPRQTVYTVQTTGDVPSLRFVLNVSGAKTYFVRETTAAPSQAPPAGAAWLPTTINRTPGRYDEFNRPHVNIHEEGAKNPKYTGGRFVRDDKSEMLVIYGYEKNMPPLNPADKGHFHAESAEAWLVFTGQIRYAFEGQAPFIASEGDVVYVPSNTWHATRFIGEAASCRLSITEYVGNTLVLEPRPPAKPPFQ